MKAGEGGAHDSRGPAGAAVVPQQRAARLSLKPLVQSESLFLPLGQATRIAFLFYLFAYRLVFPIAQAMMSEGSKDLLGPRILVEILYVCLLAYPFIFYRKEYGWLHPLVLPTVFSFGKAMVKNPSSFLMPFDFPLADFIVETASNAAALSLSNYELAWTRLQLGLILALAQAVYLAFFLFGPTFTVPRIRVYRPPSITFSALVSIGVLVGLASIFMVAKGGLSEMLIGMRSGRRELFEGMGHLVTAASMAPMIAVAWFAHEKKPWRNPLFLAGFALALLTSLLTSGSRSNMILPVLTVVLLWWRQRGRALIVPTMITAFFGLFIIGSFGAIRQDWGSNTIDLSVINPFNAGSTITTALADIERRQDKEAVLAVVAGANEKGLLWGKSYINGVTFWVPRALWKGKPPGTDVYHMWINFVGNPITARPPQIGTWGIPVPAELEAYWNFGVPGVVVVFGLLGAFHASMVRAAYVYRTVPLFWVFYVTTIVTMTGSVKDVVNMLISTSVLVAFAFFAGILRLSSGADDAMALAVPNSGRR